MGSRVDRPELDSPDQRHIYHELTPRAESRKLRAAALLLLHRAVARPCAEWPRAAIQSVRTHAALTLSLPPLVNDDEVVR